MCGIIRSELLKICHTFSMKLVFIAPIITLLLGCLLSGDYMQISVYNWWYIMILPLVVSLWSANMVVREKKTGMQNIACLPIRFEKIWVGKVVTAVLLLFMANVLLWASTTLAGMITKVTVFPLDGLIGCMLLFLTYLWQIPVSMWLAGFIGYIPTVLVSLAANIVLSVACAEKEWFLAVPYAIPARIVCPYFKIHTNGLPIEEGSLLLTDRYVPSALLISLVLALVIFWISVKWFSRGGLEHE